MHGMDITDARTFIAVLDSGSVSRAASELHLTQPAVTRRLQRFEQAVGAPLIDRRRRPFTLTDVGRAAVEQCRRLIATAEQLRSLTQAEVVPSREIHVGVAHALTEFALSEPVDRLGRDFPGVALRLYTGWSRDLLSRVRTTSLDAAMILLSETESLPANVQGEVLGSERLVVVASRRRKLESRRLAELGYAGWILNPEGCFARAALQKALARAGIALRVIVETYNYELQLALIARDRGLGLVPRRLLANSASQSRLRVLRVPGLAFPLNIWMVTGELSPALAPPLSTLGRALGERLARRRVARFSAPAAGSARCRPPARTICRH